MEIVTGYAGKKHVTANKQGCMHIGLAGNGDYILQDGEKLRAEIITNNKIRIYDGDLVMQGRQAHIAPGSYEDVTISNGGQDVKRNDIIAAQYVMDSDTGVESITLVVIEGIAGSTAADPALTTGDIRGGDTLHEMPLYRVKLNGLTVEAVEQIAPVLPSLDSLNRDLAGIQTSFSQARADLISALASKGVTVSNNATISECIMQIQNISTGKIINCGNGTIMGGTKTHSIKSYYSNYQKLTSSNFLVNPNSLYRGAYDGGQNYTYSIKKSYNSSTGILTFTMESKEFSDLTRLNYTLYLIVY